MEKEHEKTYSTISFCEENYKEYYESLGRKEVNETAMWDDVKDFLRIALKNNYQMKVWYDGMTVIIQYDYADEEFGGASLEWVGEDEYIETISREVEDE